MNNPIFNGNRGYPVNRQPLAHPGNRPIPSYPILPNQQVIQEPKKEPELKKEKEIKEEEDDDNSSTDSDDILDLQIKDDTPYEKVVKKQVKLGNLIKKLEDDKKVYTEDKKPCEEFLLKYMKDHNESSIEIIDGRLVINKSETKKTLTQDTISDTIESLINSLFDVLIKSKDIDEKVKNKFNIPSLVKQTMEKMDQDRGKQSREYLKRINKRAPKKKAGKAAPKKKPVKK